MFRKMRRLDRKMSNEEAVELFKKCEYGVLSTVSADGYAYGVPLSYVFLNNSIYFHCASSGHKLDNIKNNDRVSFCVVGNVENVPHKYTTKYESAIAFGRASEVCEQEKHLALMAIAKKYSSQFMDGAEEYIKKNGDAAKIIKISIEYISGKANR